MKVHHAPPIQFRDSRLILVEFHLPFLLLLPRLLPILAAARERARSHVRRTPRDVHGVISGERRDFIELQTTAIAWAWLINFVDLFCCSKTADILLVLFVPVPLPWLRQNMGCP